MAPGQNHEESTHPIQQIRCLSEDQLQQLRQRWIDTVEAFLGLTATPEGKSGLAELLGVSPEQMEPLMEQAIDVVGPDMAQRLMSPRPGGPTGVILTDEQKKRLGLR
jgi:hypothetical protein